MTTRRTDPEFFLKTLLYDAKGMTTPLAIKARLEAIKLLLALQGKLPAGFAADASLLPPEPPPPPPLTLETLHLPEE